MKYVICYCVIILLSVSCDRQPTGDLSPKLVQSIEDRINNGITPSIVVGIVDKEGPRYYSFGKKSLTGDSVNEHTIYEIGSISKVFTGILLAHQAETGTLNINDPIQKYLPSSVRVPKRAGKEIILGYLADHTSGLPRMPNNFDPKDFNNPYADYTVEQLYSFLSGYSLPRDIRAEYEYSNFAQGLLGHILALNAGVSYEELMINTIARPLQMSETKIVFDENMKRNLALGHSEGDEVSNWDIPTLAGAGGIRSSTHDMLKFLSANLELTQNPLKSAMNKSHETRHFLAGEFRVGLGWHIGKGKHGDIIWHNGGTGGYRTFIGFVKEIQKGVVVFTNSTEGADDIGFKLLNPDATLTPVKSSVIPVLRKTLDSLGVDATIRQYTALKRENSEEYEYSERALNSFGKSYLKRNISAALAILRLTAEEYPDSYKAYNNYADALLQNGDSTNAIEYYKKSLTLNPANIAAIQVLEKSNIKWEPPVVSVPEETLEEYTGTYDFTNGIMLTVSREGKRLYGLPTGVAKKAELIPKSHHQFYLKDLNLQLSFDEIDNSVTLHQAGKEMKGKKLK